MSLTFRTISLGIVFSSGHRWKINRTFTMSMLREFGFGKKSFESNIMKEVEVVINVFAQQAGKPMCVTSSDFITVSIANIMCDVTLGRRFDSNDQDFLDIVNAINAAASNVNTIGALTVFPFLAKIPGDPFRGQDTIKQNQLLQNSVRKMLKEHLQTYEESHIRDFIDAYIRKMRQESQGNEQDFNGTCRLVLLTNTLSPQKTNPKSLLMEIQQRFENNHFICLR